MSIRDRFRDSKKRTKIGTIKNKFVDSDQTESERYIKSFVKLKEGFLPPVDYLDPENYARYGNPKSAYEIAITKIYEHYPYDGTLADKVDWENKNSYLERYIFENEYPRKVGHITVPSSGIKTRDPSKSTRLYLYPSESLEYIEFTGGPHAHPVDSDLPAKKSESSRPVSNRVYWSNTEGSFEKMRLSNLFSSGVEGNTIEFWFKKEHYDSSSSKRQVIYDMWNNISVEDDSFSNKNYSRFRIEYVEHESRSLFYVTYIAPSSNLGQNRISRGVIDLALGYDSNYPIDKFESWHHIAVSVHNVESDLSVCLYVDGYKQDEKTAIGQACATMPVPHMATIGALRYQHEVEKLPITITVTNGNSPGEMDVEFDTDSAEVNCREWIVENRLRQNSEGILSDDGINLRTVVDDTCLYIEHLRVFFDTGTETYHEIQNEVPSLSWQTSYPQLALVPPGFEVRVRTQLKNSIGDVIREFYTSAATSPYQDALQNPVLSQKGSGTLNASIDEFRFWKKRRTSRQIYRWHSQQVGGGINTSDDNVTLGVYYKFNEGIHQEDVYNANILDYSGRSTNAKWVGYLRGGRSEVSAIEEKYSTRSEFRDPILYDNHQDVISLLQEKSILAETAQKELSSQLWRHLPSYIIEANNVLETDENSDLRKLLDILGSYLDELWLQIEAVKNVKDNKYDNFDKTPAPFLKRMLEHSGMSSPEIFVNSSIQELFHSKNDEISFERDLTEVKNLIYQNIYSNLSYIYKTKGTMEGFRSLIRCFGIDEEILKINLYSSNSEYKFEDNYMLTSVKRSYLDFYDEQNTEGLIYQENNTDYPAESPPGYSSRFIPALVPQSEKLAFQSISAEAEFYFPKNSENSTISLFGCYACDGTGDLEIDAATQSSTGDFRVTAQGFTSSYTQAAKFILKIRLGDSEHTVETPYFEDVYDDSKWNFGVTVSSALPGKQSEINASLSDSDVVVTFNACRAQSGQIIDSFSQEIPFESYLHPNEAEPHSDALLLLRSNLRFHAGATYVSQSGRPSFNTSNTLVTNCNANLGTLRVWAAPLNHEEIKQHSIKPLNTGVDNPMFDVLSVEFSDGDLDEKTQIVKSETLMLDWRFDNITSTSDTGTLWVSDYSAGHPAENSPPSLLDKIRTFYAGKGVGFSTNSEGIIDNRYIHAGKLSLPESVSSDTTIRILTQDDETFTLDSKPKKLYLAIEKSMYQNISQEMLNVMHSITEFGSLIGAPVNKYRTEYKDLNKLREIFFRNIENTPSLEKYLNFYKWIDDSLTTMLQSLMPATVDQPSGKTVKNVIESHVLERSKYQHRFPELTTPDEPPETVIRGHAELNYSWIGGHAPLATISGGGQEENPLWWKERVERDSIPGSANGSSVEAIDIVREEIREALIYQTTNDLPDKVKERNNINLDQTSKDVPKLVTAGGTKYEASPYFSRRLNKHSKLILNREGIYSGGANGSPNKRSDAYKAVTRLVGIPTRLFIRGTSLVRLEENLYSAKCKLGSDVKVEDGLSEDFFDGSMVFPFSLYERKSLLFDEPTNTVSSVFKDVSPHRNLDITGIHIDSYGNEKSVPMQGPFTSEHVGGNQHRHIPVGTPALSEIPIPYTSVLRPESFKIMKSLARGGAIQLSSPTINSYNLTSDADLVADISIQGGNTQLIDPNANTAGGEPLFRVFMGSLHGQVGDYVDVFFNHLYISNSYTLKKIVSDQYVLRLTSDLQNSAAVSAEEIAAFRAHVSSASPTLLIITNRNQANLVPYRIITGLAPYMRDEFAKRPVNIRNIKNSGNVLGNFRFQYEIMRAGDRAKNNRDFVENTQNYSDLENLSLYNKSLRTSADDFQIVEPSPPRVDTDPVMHLVDFTQQELNIGEIATVVEGYNFTRMFEDIIAYNIDNTPPGYSEQGTGLPNGFEFSLFGPPGPWEIESLSEVYGAEAIPLVRNFFALSGYSTDLDSNNIIDPYPQFSVLLEKPVFKLPGRETESMINTRPDSESNGLITNNEIIFSLYKSEGMIPYAPPGEYPSLNGSWLLVYSDTGMDFSERHDHALFLATADVANVRSTDMYDLVTGGVSHLSYILPVEQDEFDFSWNPADANTDPDSGAKTALVPNNWIFTPAGGNVRFRSDVGNYDVMLLGSDQSGGTDTSGAQVEDPPLNGNFWQVAEWATPFETPPGFFGATFNLAVEFEIAALQPDLVAPAGPFGVLAQDFNINQTIINGPNPAGSSPESLAEQPTIGSDDVWVQYELSQVPGTWVDLIQVSAANRANYADWTLKQSAPITVGNDSQVRLRIINRVTGSIGRDIWGIRNFKVLRNVAQPTNIFDPQAQSGGIDTQYTALKINTPFSRQPGRANSIDLQFDLTFGNPVAIPNGAQPEKVWIVTAKTLPNNRIEPLSYDELDLSSLNEKAGLDIQLPRNSIQAGNELTRFIQDWENENNTISRQINIPEGEEIVFFFLIEKLADNFALDSGKRYWFRNFDIRYSDLSAENLYTMQEIKQAIAEVAKTPLEKENINRGLSGRHIIVERFSAPGDIYTMGEGSLDRFSGQYSPYNALSFRNRKLSNLLNIESSKVYNGPYEGSIVPRQQIHDARLDTSISRHKVHHNTRYRRSPRGIYEPGSTGLHPDVVVAYPLSRPSSEWKLAGGPDIDIYDPLDPGT